MKVLIVEDEIYVFKALRCMIQDEYPSAEIYGPIIDLIGLKQAMSEQSNYDVIYCDIRLEDGICFSVLDKIDVTTPMIFTTSYREYALEAFEANGIAYLLKPVNRQSLRKATDKAMSLTHGSLHNPESGEKRKRCEALPFMHYLKAEAYNGSLIINVVDVYIFMTDGKHSLAMMSNGTKYRIAYSLDKLMYRLNPMMFFRANRQYIINRNAIHRIQNYGNRQLVLSITNNDDIQVLVSKEKVALLYSWIEQ